MAEKKTKDAASKADLGPMAKTEAKAEGSPKAEQPADKPAKAEPETKDKPEAKIAAPAAAKTERPPASTREKPAPGGHAATASGKDLVNPPLPPDLAPDRPRQAAAEAG